MKVRVGVADGVEVTSDVCVAVRVGVFVAVRVEVLERVVVGVAVAVDVAVLDTVGVGVLVPNVRVKLSVFPEGATNKCVTSNK